MPKNYCDVRIKVPRFNDQSGFYTSLECSKIMNKIRGGNTKPELLFRKARYAKGYRCHIGYKNLLGRSDIVLKKYKTILFINAN